MKLKLVISSYKDYFSGAIDAHGLKIQGAHSGHFFGKMRNCCDQSKILHQVFWLQNNTFL